MAQDNGVRLTYRTTARNGTPLDVAELVPFAFTPTRFGGRRTWFQWLACSRGCRVLYGGRWFRCRRCHGLRYDSQHEPYHQRALYLADKLRKRVADQLGGALDEGAFDDFPPKPPRMRWATYCVSRIGTRRALQRSPRARDARREPRRSEAVPAAST
jgi:hypothetical protein